MLVIQSVVYPLLSSSLPTVLVSRPQTRPVRPPTAMWSSSSSSVVDIWSWTSGCRKLERSYSVREMNCKWRGSAWRETLQRSKVKLSDSPPLSQTFLTDSSVNCSSQVWSLLVKSSEAFKSPDAFIQKCCLTMRLHWRRGNNLLFGNWSTIKCVCKNTYWTWHFSLLLNQLEMKSLIG